MQTAAMILHQHTLNIYIYIKKLVLVFLLSRIVFGEAVAAYNITNYQAAKSNI